MSLEGGKLVFARHRVRVFVWQTTHVRCPRRICLLFSS